MEASIYFIKISTWNLVQEDYIVYMNWDEFGVIMMSFYMHPLPF